MADVPRQWQILQAVQAKLQTISTDNGYRTNAGADVRLEPSQFEATDAPRLTLYSMTKTRPVDSPNRGERDFTFVVEAVVAADLETTHQTIVAIDEDIEQALAQFPPMPNALPCLFEESIILERPDGIAAMVVQQRYTTRFRR